MRRSRSTPTATTRNSGLSGKPFEDHVTVPCEGFVIGEPVSLIEFDYDGNERRGLTARCRREDDSEHVVAASDVVVPQRSIGARYIAAYRKWLGFEPFHPSPATATHRRRGTKAVRQPARVR
ncbi:MAG: hypothetical protein AABN34_27515 [Acidobacteriota bacterium]